MIVCSRVVQLRDYLDAQESDTMGFVPTMGALHKGHLALITQSRFEVPLTVCSIFVNPRQFNEKSDLETYPRPVADDIEKLFDAECDVLFAPPVGEIYPPGLTIKPGVEIGHLTDELEGNFRPGHFEGVVQVVHRLLQIVQPTHLYMGQKDFQQFVIVSHLVQHRHPGVTMVMCPTVRESDGLAMSSRNRNLSPDMRKRSVSIYEALSHCRESLGKKDISDMEAAGRAHIEKSGLRVEYFSIVDGHNLREISDADDVNLLIACVAAWAGNIRLIDNIILKGNI